MAIPYGLYHQVHLPTVFTDPIPDVVYDPRTQLNMIRSIPLVQQPNLLRQFSVTWNTPNRDNETDEGG